MQGIHSPGVLPILHISPEQQNGCGSVRVLRGLLGLSVIIIIVILVWVSDIVKWVC